MKIAIFSDIHGNAEALRAILNDIESSGINDVVCLGDTIAIGPSPKECLDLIIENGVEMLLGNHELYYLKGTQIDDEINPNLVEHHVWLKKQITGEQRAFLEKCSLTSLKELDNGRALFEHFLIDDNSTDEYPFLASSVIDGPEIEEIVNSLDCDKVFVGHTHRPAVVADKLYVLGPSGCGKTNMTHYTIFNTDTFGVDTKAVEYDRNKFVEKLRASDYPGRAFVAENIFDVEL